MPFASLPQILVLTLPDARTPGVFNIFSYPEGYRNFARILSSHLTRDGLFLTRIHTQSEPKENPQDVAALYLSEGITDYHELRFRFITAMQTDTFQGVLSSKDIIDSHMERFGIFLPELYRRTGYVPPPEIKNLPVRTGIPPMKATYPTQNEFLDSVREHFQLLDVRYGDHALAHQCPIYRIRWHPNLKLRLLKGILGPSVRTRRTC